MLEQLVGLAELIGAAGVILSLLYVGRQLKQTNAMSRSAARQALSSQFNGWAMGIATSPDLAQSLAKVSFDGLVRNTASDLERIQIGYAYAAIVEQVHMAWQHEKDGILTEKETNELYQPSGALFDRPYMLSLWDVIRDNYADDFCIWFERKYGVPTVEQGVEQPQ